MAWQGMDGASPLILAPRASAMVGAGGDRGGLLPGAAPNWKGARVGPFRFQVQPLNSTGGALAGLGAGIGGAMGSRIRWHIAVMSESLNADAMPNGPH